MLWSAGRYLSYGPKVHSLESWLSAKQNRHLRISRAWPVKASLYNAKSMSPQSSERSFAAWHRNAISYNAHAAPSKFLLTLVIVLKYAMKWGVFSGYRSRPLPPHAPLRPAWDVPSAEFRVPPSLVPRTVAMLECRPRDGGPGPRRPSAARAPKFVGSTSS